MYSMSLYNTYVYYPRPDYLLYVLYKDILYMGIYIVNKHLFLW